MSNHLLLHPLLLSYYATKHKLDQKRRGIAELNLIEGQAVQHWG